ncbi:NAD(P)-binding domain-containing protein [Aeromicrobium panaciterrae]|uniref:NAD(P)-dependent oxidoreductase n=1 Tax=Aeromicrobium panaciterrae TaxID=363861 RepID=UPI0031D69A75
MSDVLVLGAGLMGTQVARCLARSGLDVAVWNRTPERAAPLAGDGIELHSTPAQAFASAPLVVSVLASTEALRSVLARTEGADLSRVTLVNLTTGTPDDAVQTKWWADEHGVAYLDGMISGRPGTAGTDQMHIAVAGPEAAWSAHRDTLARLSPAVHHTGEDVVVPSVLGLACTGTFFLSTLGAFVEAAAFASAYGIAPDQVAAEIPRYLDRVATEVEGFTALMNAGDFVTPHASTDVYADALEAAASSMASVGQPGHVTRGAIESLRVAQDAGRGGESPAVVFDVLT